MTDHHPLLAALLLTIGGAVGTNARYWLGVSIAHWCRDWLVDPYANLRGPLAIFAINVSGSLLLGLFVVPLRERLPAWWILLGVGFCGGYTTFSSFAVDTVELIRKHHQPGLAIANVVASVLISCAVVWLAVAGMETIHPHANVEAAVKEAADRETQTEP